MATVPATAENIAKAAKALQDGELVAFPTETVYGLGADARNGIAVARIYEAKGRPSFNPLIVHTASFEMADTIGQFSTLARRLAGEFWPGPLTLVVPLRETAGIASLATAGLDTIGIRVPDHPVARRLLSSAAIPVAAPSANLSGHVSPTTASHVQDDLDGKPAMILDGGPTAHGLESTVLDVTGDRAVELRPGAITRDAISSILGQNITNSTAKVDAPMSPGMLASHYAPRTPLRLDTTEILPGEALLAFGPAPLHHHGPMVNLSARADLIEAASRLFAALRQLDRSGASRIAVMPIPDTGLGAAINDRLRRAATAR